ncbi:hypothetical protein OCK02_23875 [Rhizobium sp. TRM96647]|uniref:hypothetical protein n=1 Tax=unclassified Rhizobium TaxID=2613769 RepID=UPI0021E7B3EA|nr:MULTISPECIES: hypothetical protein [unclassified Rhizobium]MCV3739218.1 hypothetical protein [Rhizobium sp. TRM96647]MCV3760904.1 hypothetical protein [Rhizobium sp. TRM96650]
MVGLRIGRGLVDDLVEAGMGQMEDHVHWFDGTIQWISASKRYSRYTTGALQQ